MASLRGWRADAQSPYERLQFASEKLPVSHVLPLICALAVLVGAVIFAHQGGDRGSFVELGAVVPPHGSATLPA